MLVAVAILGACKKDTATTTCTLSSTSIVGTYKLTAMTNKVNDATPAVDLYASFDACQKDDLYAFNNGGTYVISEGATSCTPTNASSGTWTLSGTTFTLDGDPAEISNFSCTGFEVKVADPATGAVTNATFAKQ